LYFFVRASMPAITDLPRADWNRLNRLLEAALALDESARSDCAAAGEAAVGHRPD
jgi:hypothetical protein